MKRLFLFILTCFIITGGIYSALFLPADTKELIEYKYNNWSGVIRVWTIEGSGITPWLNECAAATEKHLNGVYISINEVPYSAILNCTTSGINPPDIIVYPSYVSLPEAELYSIDISYPLRSGLIQSSYAVPILLQPNFWIYDRSVLPALPGDMYSVNAACSEDSLNSLVALSTGLRPAQGNKTPLPGLDIGLGAEMPEPSSETDGISCRINPELIICDNPRSLFVKGEISAFIGGIDDILQLSESCDIAVSITGKYAYASDVLLFSIIDKKDSRTEACISYLDKIMTYGQSYAARARSFPAVTGVSAWSGDILLASAENASEGLLWLQGTDKPQNAAYLYIEGKLSADEAVQIMINNIY